MIRRQFLEEENMLTSKFGVNVYLVSAMLKFIILPYNT